MAKSQRNALRAGIFMLASLALVIFVIVAISGAGRFTESFKTYAVAFTLQDDIGGLRVGDDVRIGGLKVGDVRNIEIPLPSAQRPAPAVVVSINIPAKYPLARDAEVYVQRGLTGAAAINIVGLGSGAQLAAGEALPGKPDPVAGLLHNLSEMQPDIRQVVANVKIASGKLNTDLDKFAKTADSFTETGQAATETVHDLHARVPQIVDRYNALTAAAVKMLDTIREFIGPSNEDFHATVANLNQITGDVRQRLPDLLDRVQEILAKADTALGRASSAMEQIQATVANAREASGAMRSILVDNKSKFDGISSSLKTTSDNLKYASMEIRHSPWRLLYQPKPDEMANLNIYDSVRQFAEGANSLDDAAGALRDALKDPNADPGQVKKLMDHLDDSFAKFQAVQEKMWKDVKG